MADRLFKHCRRSCHACAGSGLASLSDRAWGLCPHCEGTGGFWEIPAQRVEAIRNEILQAFPEAGAPTDLQFLSGVLVQDLSTGRIVGCGPATTPGGKRR